MHTVCCAPATCDAFDNAHADSLAKATSLSEGRIAIIVVVSLMGLALLILWINMSNGNPGARQLTSADSPTPLQVFNYSEDMWNSAKASGNPISDDWDNPVFDSASKHFGISTDKVRDLYLNETNRRAGIN